MSKMRFPDYPRTRHLPWKPNAVRDDLVASEAEAQVIFAPEGVYVEEKVDGSNCGMMLWDGQPVLRNRSHILGKGYLKNTPAKVQFRPAWNWFYDNKHCFDTLNALYGAPLGVYGEWMYALHGIEYDRLPSLFLAYDVYDPDLGRFLPTPQARGLLDEAGFKTVPLLCTAPLTSYEELEKLCQEPSPFSSKDSREGVYVKVVGEGTVLHRFKMLRPGFVQGCKWNDRMLTRNKLL